MSSKETVEQWLRFDIKDYERKKQRAKTEAERQKAKSTVEALKSLQKKVMGQL